MAKKNKPKTLKDLLSNGKAVGRSFYEAPRGMATPIYDFKRGTMTLRNGGVYELVDLVNSSHNHDALVRYLGDKRVTLTRLQHHYNDPIATAKQIRQVRENRFGIIKSYNVAKKF